MVLICTLARALHSACGLSVIIELSEVASHDFIWRLQNRNCISFRMTLGKKHSCLTHILRPSHAYKYACIDKQLGKKSGANKSALKIAFYQESN